MTEDQIYEQIAQYLNIRYPLIPYRFDQGGMWTSSHKARNLYGRLNTRAWPDLFIAWPAWVPQLARRYCGLFIEIKRDGTRLKKRDGSWASNHIAEQAAVLAELNDAHYLATFAVGFEECKTIIGSYLLDSQMHILPNDDGKPF